MDHRWYRFCQRYSLAFISIALINAAILILICKKFRPTASKDNSFDTYALRNSDSSLIDSEEYIFVQQDPVQYHQSTRMTMPSDQKLSPIIENNHHSALPAFTLDGGDFVFSSLIELSFDQFGPFVTTFFLDPQHLVPHLASSHGIIAVDPAYQNAWKEMSRISLERELNYDIAREMSGKRISKYEYVCVLKNSINDPSYSVKGYFLPNRLALYPHSNRQLDILRCPIQDAVNASNALSDSNHEIQVEIQWNSQMILNFTIPWITRRTGYILDSKSKQTHKSWKPRNAEPFPPTQNKEWKPVVHLCMPGTRLMPSKRNVAIMYEYLSHHTLLGFSHVYFVVSAVWGSPLMKSYQSLLQSYESDGMMTLMSSAYDVNGVTSCRGLMWEVMPQKIFASTMILFLAKGQADYLAVFDVDEFFIPKVEYSSIADIIRMNDIPSYLNDVVPGDGKKGAVGFADKQMHPLCYFQIYSEIVNTPPSELIDYSIPWIGSRYKHGPEIVQHGAKYDPYAARKRIAHSKAIYPTRRIYQGGFNIGAACRLEWKWTICGNETSDELEFCEKGYGVPDRVSSYHRFDEIVGNKKLKTIDPWNHAVMYHFMVHKPQPVASGTSLNNTNDYSRTYFPRVMNDIRMRGINIYIDS